MAVMRAADEAWNARDWETFAMLHTKDVVVPSPSNPKGSRGIQAHSKEMKAFIHAFPDHHITLPYKVTFASGDWIVAVHENGGTFTNEWVFPNGYTIPPTGKRFNMIMATIGKVKDGRLEYELLIFDQGGMMNQLGVQ